MRMIPRLLTTNRASLRVTTSDATGVAFDALVLHDRALRRPEVQVIRGVTPFDCALPDGDVTIVVRAADHAPELTVEYVLESGGAQLLRGRTRFATPVIHVRGGRITCAGFAREERDVA
jgi:hypothetical protein